MLPGYLSLLAKYASDVTIMLKKAVDGMVTDSLSTGPGRRMLSEQYGVKPFTGQ